MLRLATIFALGIALAGCATASAPTEQSVTVTGSVTYRERIALPPTAEIEARLDDVSLADAPARTLARQSLTSGGRQVPFAFALTVKRSEIDARHSYALAARITDGDGKLKFITDTRNSVAFDDRTTIDMGMISLVRTP